MAKRKSWGEKLSNNKGLPRVERIPVRMSPRWGTGTIAIPAPAEVDAIMKQVPRGKLITIKEIQARIAAKHGATIGCPITTGIFAWISAHAAEEAAAQGKVKITPYWRTLKSGGELNPKYPGGVEQLRKRLEVEGHRVVARGKRFVVQDYERHLLGRRPKPSRRSDSW
jgi:alkylated DNA nucleotide flippase Atl1